MRSARATLALALLACGASESPPEAAPPEPYESAAMTRLDLGGADPAGVMDHGSAREGDAWDACMQAVQDRLRSPSTARFPWGYNNRVVSLGGGRYRVRAYVDAVNAFGAEVRTDFDCTVVWVGADQWRLDDLTLTPR